MPLVSPTALVYGCETKLGCLLATEIELLVMPRGLCWLLKVGSPPSGSKPGIASRALPRIPGSFSRFVWDPMDVSPDSTLTNSMALLILEALAFSRWESESWFPPDEIVLG